MNLATITGATPILSTFIYHGKHRNFPGLRSSSSLLRQAGR